MIIIRSSLLNRFPEIIFGFSTKIGLNRNEPFYFNLSLNVGDDEKIVNENRIKYFNKLGISELAYQSQTHGNTVKVVNKAGHVGYCDALITNKKKLGLAITSADCSAIFLYDNVNNVIASIHSGWRGTEKKILEKTIHKMMQEFNTNPQNVYAYIAPSISMMNYEIGKDVAEKFNSKYVLKNGKNMFLNVSLANFDILISNGIQKDHIQVSDVCSFETSSLLHSYRRDGEISGRALGIIALRDNNEK
ncbi:MAG: peptidoglycan editing factor PgeF [Ignavibacteriales bacterium]|nr:peptidoglycan editing factor PgeF [Ignavibacteriales bacterium]